MHSLERRLRERLEVTEFLIRSSREARIPPLEVADPYRRAIDDRGRPGATLGFDHAIASCNDQFALLLKTPEADLTGRSFRARVFEDDRSAWDELAERAVERGAAGGHLRLLRPVSAPVPVHVALAPFGRSNVAYSLMVTRLDAPGARAEARAGWRLWLEILERVRSGGDPPRD